MGDALKRIVHHHRQLVSPQAIGAFEHKVADLLRHILLLSAQPSVMPSPRRGQSQIGDHFLHIQAPSPRYLALQAIAASARVNRRVVALALDLCVFNVFARTTTGVSPILGKQLV